MYGLEFIAPMIGGVSLIVTTGGVIILRPLSRRLEGPAGSHARSTAGPLDAAPPPLSAAGRRAGPGAERPGSSPPCRGSR